MDRETPPFRPLVVRVCDLPKWTGLQKTKLRRDILDKPGGIPTIKVGASRGAARLVRVSDIERWLERLAGESAQ